MLGGIIGGLGFEFSVNHAKGSSANNSHFLCHNAVGRSGKKCSLNFDSAKNVKNVNGKVARTQFRTPCLS